MHGHELNGPISKSFAFDVTTRFELETSVGEALYLSLTNTFLGLNEPEAVSNGKRPALNSDKVAYIVAVDESDEPTHLSCSVRFVQMVYRYDGRWWLATARHH